MNCKRGDLAIYGGVIKAYLGVIVEVIELAPSYRFQLPDGQMHQGVGVDCWIIKFPRDFLFPTSMGTGRISQYAITDDYKLRPVSGLPMQDEVTEEQKVPA